MIKNSRRKFVKLLPYVLAGGFAYPLSKFLFFSEDPDTKYQTSLKKLKNGVNHIENPQIFIYKENDKIEVFNAHCTHMGCILNFDKTTKQYYCPCHKSKFDIDGKVLRGPAKKDLDKISFKIKNKTLFVG
jgi:cytochrome b6-f complex iron-sulfur subunit